jgi:hypothetical protein
MFIGNIRTQKLVNPIIVSNSHDLDSAFIKKKSSEKFSLSVCFIMTFLMLLARDAFTQDILHNVKHGCFISYGYLGLG